ncbi:hypothetical protein PIB30_044219 [Stylosanthes scabra]|uniref:F5/8 type C domain-containing protein n=1 Tax=Stylosanthes scabra TaxID=79078 RepID=A0ABU6UGB6_9FABA|nr:hypothetical protein [Stylosanthes scabra]
MEAASHCKVCLVRQGHLCVASNNHNEETFRTEMWQLSQTDGLPNWTRMYTYQGPAPTYRPFLMVEEDEIQIMERHMGVFGLENINITHFHITRYQVVEKVRHNLQWIEYSEDVTFRSIFCYSPTVFLP